MSAQSLRVGIIVGEASGDLLGEGLLLAFKQHYPSIIIEGVIGPRLQAMGGHTLYEMEALSMMGFIEPLRHLPRLLMMRHKLIKHFLQNPPDIFIGIDSPDFTLGVEKQLKKAGIKTVHYVSPSVWAWRTGRIKTIKKAVDLMLVLFPFEQNFYQDKQVPAVFVGHPLADAIPMHVDQKAVKQALHLHPELPTLAVLPGSRLSEIKYLAPLYLQVIQRLRKTIPNLQCVVPLASPKIRAAFSEIANGVNVTMIDGDAQKAMQASDVVLLTSGTATLEAMLCHRPMVVAFRSSAVNIWLIRKLVKIPFFSLPNLLFNKKVVPEFLQEDASVENLTHSLLAFFQDHTLSESVQAQFIDMHQTLRMQASQQAAAAVIKLLR